MDTSRLGRLAKLTAKEVVEKASAAAFGRPLVANYLRSQLVEAMIAEALEPVWRWVSADWAGWDFSSGAGRKLEVKQSAVRQSWASDAAKTSRSSFDVAARTGYWVGENWLERVGRNADIYIFAHHPVADKTADHRDPQQWVFYVVPEQLLLPTSQKTIALSRIRSLTASVGLDRLLDEVTHVDSTLQPPAA